MLQQNHLDALSRIVSVKLNWPLQFVSTATSLINHPLSNCIQYFSLLIQFIPFIHNIIIFAPSSRRKLQLFTKYFRQTVVFMWNSTLREKFIFFFFRRFLLVLLKFTFREQDQALGNNSMKFWCFHDIS